MEEIVFQELLGNTKFSNINHFIASVINKYTAKEVTYEDVKESILKLVIYRFIKVDNSDSTSHCISKEDNFYEAKELGGVNSWLAHKRSLSAAV